MFDHSFMHEVKDGVTGLGIIDDLVGKDLTSRGRSVGHLLRDGDVFSHAHNEEFLIDGTRCKLS